MVARYSVAVWDHEIGRLGNFSGALASKHLGGPSSGLGFHEVGRALRHLRSKGWSELSIYITREGGNNQ